MSAVIMLMLESCGLFLKKNKTLLIFMVTFLWILFWNRTVTQDRTMYAIYYDTISRVSTRSNLEFGFQIVMLLAKKLHMSFTVFMAIFSSIPFMIIYKFTKEYSENPLIVICLYFLYPFILDADQVRSFFAFAIVLSGVHFLFEEKLGDNMKFVLVVLFAMLFHVSSCCYLVYIMIILKKKMIALLTLSGCLLILFGKNILVQILNLLSFRDISYKIASHIENSINANALVVLAFFFVVFLLSIFVSTYAESHGLWEKHKCEIVTKLNTISFVLLPLIAIDNTFTRLPRLVLFIDYVLLSNSISKKDVTVLKELLFCLIFLSIAMLRFVLYFSGDGLAEYIKPLFWW